MMNFDSLRTLLDAAGLYLTGEDNLRLTTFGGVANLVVVLEGRLVSPEGKIVPLSERQIPNSDYTAKSTIFPLAEGVLTNAQLRLGTGTAGRGSVFGVLEVVRGNGVNAQALSTLLAGYITTNGRLAWPGSPIESSINGPGRIRSITGTNPAANVEISEVVPVGTRWRLISWQATLVADANVATRTAELIIDDGTTVIVPAFPNVNQTAGQTMTYTAGVFGSFGSVAGAFNLIALPESLMLAAGFRIRTSTTNRQVGDDWTAPQMLVEEWIE